MTTTTDNNYAIRIHWGYWMLYGNYAFGHADHSWDGGLMVKEGTILNCSLIDFSGYAGPGRESYIALSRPQWHWHSLNANNRLGGVFFELRGGPESEVSFTTRTISFNFRIEDLLKRKVLVFHAGPRYSNVDVTVMFDGFDPELDSREHLELLTAEDGRFRALLDAKSFQGSIHRWFRTDWLWISPGNSADIEITLPSRTGAKNGEPDLVQTTLRCAAAFPIYKDETFEQILDRGRSRIPEFPPDIKKEVFIPYELRFQSKQVAKGEQFFTCLGNVPLMEEISATISGRHLARRSGTLSVFNRSEDAYLLVARVYLEETTEPELSVACPKWVMLGTEFSLILTCSKEQRSVKIETHASVAVLTPLPPQLPPGEHSVALRIDEALAYLSVVISSETSTCTATIEQVFAAQPETFPMLVGIEDKTLPVNSPGHREEIIRHLAISQMGDFFIFRLGSEPDATARLAALCRQYGVYCRCAQSMGFERFHIIKKEAGQFCLGYEWTEHDGPLWGYIQTPLPERKIVEKSTMRTAHEGYLEYIRSLVSMVRQEDPDTKVWLMVSALGHNFAYEGGIDICHSQFNKSHNVILLSDARGAAKAYGKPMWGTYQAEGAHVNPEGSQHLRMWWLSLYLAYVSGAMCANDEECTYRTWHERLYSRGDRMPRTRRKIMREFNRYVKTHPRRGNHIVKQAVLLGRHACDATDGIGAADKHKNSALPMVWRNFGEWSDLWRPSEAEYGLRHLDVFFPGAWLQTLEQSPDDVRRWYSGSPYGELDLIPPESDQAVLNTYSLLLMLGWNTANEEQYEKLKAYVREGGRLFMSIPHLSQNEEREFLWNGLEPLNLLHGGDFIDLFGVKIKGPGHPVVSIASQENVTDNPLDSYAQSPTFFHLPSVPPHHREARLAEIVLVDAEVLAREVKTGAPVLVRRRFGKGEAFLLCTYSYPGNSWLMPFVSQVVRSLAESTPSLIELSDGSGDVYFTIRREEALCRIHLLNTDWTCAANEKQCEMRLGNEWIDISVREGRLSEVVWSDSIVFLIENAAIYVENVVHTQNYYTAKIHGFGHAEVKTGLFGRSSIKSVMFEGEPVEVFEDNEWIELNIDFHGRSVGDLKIELNT